MHFMLMLMIFSHMNGFSLGNHFRAGHMLNGLPGHMLNGGGLGTGAYADAVPVVAFDPLPPGNACRTGESGQPQTLALAQNSHARDP